jgi:hypothetical protein
MDKCRSVGVTTRAALWIVLFFVLAGCAGGVTGPCDDSDPIGPCATSHSQTHGG